MKYHPPPAPDTPGIQPPMVYIQENLKWEYKCVSRNLDREKVLGEDELNALGAEGWELATSLVFGSTVTFYFRRLGK